MIDRLFFNLCLTAFVYLLFFSAFIIAMFGVLLSRLICNVLNRSGGDRGADLDTLRGTHGPDFEAYAKINRAGGAGISCGCFGSSKDDKNEKIILIKGAYCFVFTKETDPSPKYAISLAHQKVKLHQPPSHGLYRVTVETSLGDIEWELQFETKPIADQFVAAFRQQAAIGEADEVRKVNKTE